MNFIRLVLLLLFFYSCNPNSPNLLFKAVPKEKSKIDFTNKLVETYDFNILEYNYFFNGGGVGIGDFNLDGLPDVYLTGNMVSSELYINNGNLEFTKITDLARVGTIGWCAGVAITDINQDGLPDIYVSKSGHPEAEERANLLFIHQGLDKEGIPIFKEEASSFGLDDKGYSTQAAFFDYDKDGDLDAYLLTADHEKGNPNIPKPKTALKSFPSTDRLYQNNGGRFELVSQEAGIVHEGYGLGIAIADLNEDGWQDVYVANDFITEDRIYLNKQNGTFGEGSSNMLSHQSRFSMGVDISDFNNDELLDIIVMDMMPQENERKKMMNLAMTEDLFQISLDRNYQPQFAQNVLQLNSGIFENGNPVFRDIARFSGVHQTDWSWSVLFADYDNDGLKDLFITNGIPKDITNNDFIHYRDIKARNATSYDDVKKALLAHLDELPTSEYTNFFFKNEGDYSFSDKSRAWGMTESGCSNGVAYADFDGDGDLDLLINNLNRPAQLYENTASQEAGNHYLRVRLKAKKGLDDLGTKVLIQTSSTKQLQVLNPYRGFQSSMEKVLHFGIGNDSVIKKITVTWPDGNIQKLNNINVNQTINIEYRQGSALTKPFKSEDNLLFVEVSKKKGINFVHLEIPYNDFKVDPLLPWQFSKLGPCIAVGDVNGDDLDDFYVGGSSNEVGMLFKQSREGQFTQEVISDRAFEDTGALFFDADNDGDLDLYVVSGGSEFGDARAYQDRLYENDGIGNFTRKVQALPLIKATGSCVVAGDFDGDGDDDLFVGGGPIPGSYPLATRSYFLENQQGNFKDITQKVNPELETLGIVTDAIWEDLNHDGLKDLVVVGEWMSIQVFENVMGNLTNRTENWNLSGLSGMWNSLESGDFDNDGDIDIVVGNLGHNTSFNASVKEPLSIYAGYFSSNHKIDAIITKFSLNKKGQRLAYPISSYDALMTQAVALKKDKFPNYSDYSEATIDDILSPTQKLNAYRKSISHLESMYLENRGNYFQQHVLPAEAQFSTIEDISAGDFNRDGNLDVLIVGNRRTTPISEAWYDGQTGLMLAGNGKGQFTSKLSKDTGFWALGDTRAMEPIESANKKGIIIAQNKGPLLYYEYQK